MTERKWFGTEVTKVIKAVHGQHSEERKEQNKILGPVTKGGDIRGQDLAKQ